MKSSFSIVGILLVVALIVPSQVLATVQGAVYNPSLNIIEVRAKSNANITAGAFSNMVVTIRWQNSYTVDLGTITSGTMTTSESFGVSKVGSETVSGAYEYQSFTCVPAAGSITWTSGVEYVLFSIPVTGGTGTGTFELAPNGFCANDWYFEIGGGDFTNTATPFYASSVASVPLPVELVSLTASARGRNIDLSWSTKTESNNYGFDVERLNASSTWDKVGFVEGKGTTSTPQSYSYKDVVKSAGTVTYRLKQTDRDGKFTYSSQVEAKATFSPEDYKMSQNYPNPFNPSTKFNFAVQTPQQVTVRVFNNIGQEVKTLFNGVAQADQVYDVTFDGANLSSGTYYYMLKSKDRFEVKKMIMMK